MDVFYDILISIATTHLCCITKFLWFIMKIEVVSNKYLRTERMLNISKTRNNSILKQPYFFKFFEFLGLVTIATGVIFINKMCIAWALIWL